MDARKGEHPPMEYARYRILSAFLLPAAALVAHAAFGQGADWPAYGGDEQGRKYSPLDQINRKNVSQLEVAWTHRHGDMERADGSSAEEPSCSISIAVKNFISTAVAAVQANRWMIPSRGGSVAVKKMMMTMISSCSRDGSADDVFEKWRRKGT